MGGKPKEFSGVKLRKRREKRGWSQAGLSKLSGVSDEYISQLENGNNCSQRTGMPEALDSSRRCCI